MRVRVNDVSLYVDIDGSGLIPDGPAMRERPVFILLHGGPGADHTLFKPEAKFLTALGQVIYVDQRGAGRSDTGEPDGWTWDQWADDIAGLCAALDVRQPILIGASSGAVVAMACAARHPELPAGLVLDSPLGVPTTLDETVAVFERRGGEPARAAAQRYLSGDTSEEVADQWRKYGLPLYTTGGDKNVMERRIARVRMNDAVQAHFRQGRCGPVDRYRSPVPVLVLAGADDPVVPAAAVERFRPAVPDTPVQTVIVPGIGHGVLRQAPDAARRAIERFVREVRSRRDSGPGAAPATTDGAAARPV